MADLLRHRQTKGAATDMVDLTPPRHIPTLPEADGAEVKIYATGQGRTVAQVECTTPRALKQPRRGRHSPGAGGCDRAAVWRAITSNSTGAGNREVPRNRRAADDSRGRPLGRPQASGS